MTCHLESCYESDDRLPVCSTVTLARVTEALGEPESHPPSLAEASAHMCKHLCTGTHTCTHVPMCTHTRAHTLDSPALGFGIGLGSCLWMTPEAALFGLSACWGGRTWLCLVWGELPAWPWPGARLPGLAAAASGAGSQGSASWFSCFLVEISAVVFLWAQV